MSLKNRPKTSIIWKLPIEEFKKLVKESKTLGQILNFFGLFNKGGNSNTIKNRLIQENIDYSHILFESGKNRISNNRFISNDILFVENSKSTRNTIKNRIIKNKLIEYKCKECNNIGEWNGKKISLQLEHINGISNDNRLENLCFLCPNCHSQTSTFSGKNVKVKEYYKNINELKPESEKFYCKKCNNQVTDKDTNLCWDCYKKTKKLKFEVSKEELEKLIKEKSFTEIGKMFGVTDNTIRKRCKKLGIEYKKVGVGYWTIPEKLRNISKEELEELLKCDTIKTISEKYNISEHSIKQACYRFNILTKTIKNEITEIQKNKILELHKNNYTQREIEKLMNIGRYKIQKIINME